MGANGTTMTAHGNRFGFNNKRKVNALIIVHNADDMDKYNVQQVTL